MQRPPARTSRARTSRADPLQLECRPEKGLRHRPPPPLVTFACGNQGALKANRWRYVHPMTEQGPSPVTSIQLLGPVRLGHADGSSAPIRSDRERTLLAALASDAGLVVSADALIDAVWATLLPPASDTRYTSTCPRCAAAWATARRPRGRAPWVRPAARTEPARLGGVRGASRTRTSRVCKQ